LSGTNKAEDAHNARLSELIDDHGDFVMGFIDRQLPASSDREAIWQDVFLAGLKAIVTGEPLRHERAFLLEVARRKCVDEKRRLASQRRFEAAIEREGSLGELAAPSGETLLDHEQRARGVRAALFGVIRDDDERELFVQRFIHRLAYPELAELHGATSAAVQKRCERMWEKYGPRLEGSLRRQGLAPHDRARETQER
jgi:RNA polymerase sigma factor (sigma-70 family)